MHVVVARFKAKPGSDDEIAKLLAEMVPHAMEEPGCHMYIVNRLVDDPSVFLLYEQYTDAEAFAAHGQTEAFKRIVAGRVVPLLEERGREIFEVVEPAG